MSSDDELLQCENLTTGSKCLMNRRKARLRSARHKEDECSIPQSSRSSNPSPYQTVDRKRQSPGDKNEQSCSSDRTFHGEVTSSSRRKKHDDMEHIDHSYSAQRRRNQTSELNSSNGQTLHQSSPDDVELLRQMEEDERYAQMIEASPDPWARIRQMEEDERYSHVLQTSPDSWARIRQMEEDERYAQMLQASPDPVEIVRQFEEDERYARMLEASIDPIEQVRQVENDEQYARMLQCEDAEMHVRPQDRDNYSRHCVADSQGNDDVEVESHDESCDHDESDNHDESSADESEDHSDSDGGETLTVSVSVTDSDRGDFDESDDPNDDENEDSDDFDENESYLEDELNVPRGLEETEINRLPTRKFQCPRLGASSSRASGDDAANTEHIKECHVCTYELKDGELLRILTCFHEFHVACIDPWLKINRTCPVCRVEVKFDEGH